MVYGIYKQIRNASWQCLVDYGITALPVNVLHIAKSSGIIVRKNRDVGVLSGGESGKSYLFTETNEWFLVYDDECSTMRRRFIIAHELGHIFLGHEFYQTITGKNPDLEAQADRFALGLLAPACVIWGLNKSDPAEIADLCGIPMPEAIKRAERMKILYKRQKFLDSDLEKQVYRQFQDFIASYKTNHVD